MFNSLYYTKSKDSTVLFYIITLTIFFMNQRAEVKTISKLI